MAAFVQSLGQTMGQAGNDYGSAVDANLNTALSVIQNKLQMQEIQQQMRAQDQRMAAEAIRMKQMQAPTPIGSYQTPQGIFGVTFDPNKGTYGGGMVPGSEQLYAPPAELSDDAIHQFAQTLPKGVSQPEFEDVVKGYRSQGMFKEAIAFMGSFSKGAIKPQLKTLVPDQQSPTGYSEVEWDAGGNEITRVPVQPGAGVTGSTSVQTDNLTGLTTTNVRTPNRNVPQGTPNNNVPQRTIPSIAPPGPPRTPPRTVPPTPPASSADKSLLPWRGVGTYTPEDIQKMAEDWQNNGVKPEGKIAPVVQREMAAHGMTPGEKGAGTLTPQAEKILQATDPVIQQIDQLRGDIEKLNLTKNNQRGYLLVPSINYKTGSRAPVDTLGDDIAGFSLGGVIEATSVLQGGSRALVALKWARDHTPNIWVDSPSLMYRKLEEIRQRLMFIENDAKTLGQKGLRFNQPSGVTAPSGAITPMVITPEDMKK